MREIRSYGSARGVRSNPYPYRDIPPPGAPHGQTPSIPPPKLRMAKLIPPWPTPYGQEWRQNRDQEAQLIGPASGQGSLGSPYLGIGSGEQQPIETWLPFNAVRAG